MRVKPLIMYRRVDFVKSEVSKRSEPSIVRGQVAADCGCSENQTSEGFWGRGIQLPET
jgi:hypothetical protein